MTAAARYVGRHHVGPHDLRDPAGRRQIPCPIDAGYCPLDAATRIRLAPTYWADPDRLLPAPAGERTGLMPRVTADDAAEAALGEAREVAAGLAAWIDAGCPTDDQTETDASKDHA